MFPHYMSCPGLPAVVPSDSGRAAHEQRSVDGSGGLIMGDGGGGAVVKWREDCQTMLTEEGGFAKISQSMALL